MQDPSGMRVRRRMDKSRTVPTDQQPFNELQELKEDPLFGWAQEDFKVCNSTGFGFCRVCTYIPFEYIQDAFVFVSFFVNRDDMRKHLNFK